MYIIVTIIANENNKEVEESILQKVRAAKNL